MSSTVNTEEGGGEKPTSATRFDTKALNGLRGFAAFHICVFHVLHYSTVKINVYAAVRYFLTVNQCHGRNSLKFETITGSYAAFLFALRILVHPRIRENNI